MGKNPPNQVYPSDFVPLPGFARLSGNNNKSSSWFKLLKVIYSPRLCVSFDW